jgi:hypothetical protein
MQILSRMNADNNLYRKRIVDLFCMENDSESVAGIRNTFFFNLQNMNDKGLGMIILGGSISFFMYYSFWVFITVVIY